jgi:23S rRNA (pseudouridine1915-N3)-methyltransferase
MPAWVQSGYEDYAARLPRECSLRLIEVAAAKRNKGAPLERMLHEEGERLRAAVPGSARILALDERGRQWTTAQLAGQLADWRQDGRDVALLVGGPDGLDPALKQQAEGLWSLSPLTLPHPLVRVILAEQIYRAWSILCNHPYHRA